MGCYFFVICGFTFGSLFCSSNKRAVKYFEKNFINDSDSFIECLDDYNKNKTADNFEKAYKIQDKLYAKADEFLEYYPKSDDKYPNILWLQDEVKEYCSSLNKSFYNKNYKKELDTKAHFIKHGASVVDSSSSLLKICCYICLGLSLCYVYYYHKNSLIKLFNKKIHH